MLYHARSADVRRAEPRRQHGEGLVSITRATLVIPVVVIAMAFSWGMATARVAAMRPPQAVDAERFDRLLDLYVRDGLVYYSALKGNRLALDRFVAAIADEPQGFVSWPIDGRKAFWLNAYNALVLETVLDSYPIRGSAPDYPSNSIQQIPGAFGRRTHEVAGRTLTLNAIETTVIAAFGDPRLFLALGRGAVDSGRLRSETYSGPSLEVKLEQVVAEFATTARHVTLDRFGRELRVSAIFGWREADFVTAQADRGWTASGRTPLERAILTTIAPKLFPSERAFLTENEFALQYHEFDWRLNDLTGGRPSNR